MDALLRGQPVEMEERVALARRLARAGELTDLALIESCLLAGVADEENLAEELEAVSPERFDPWRNWLVEAWHKAVYAWGQKNLGTVIDCTPTWDGRSTWASQAEWHKKARASETDQDRLERRCRSLALDWHSWQVRPLEDVVARILERNLAPDEESALELACVAIDEAAKLT